MSKVVAMKCCCSDPEPKNCRLEIELSPEGNGVLEVSAIGHFDEGTVTIPWHEICDLPGKTACLLSKEPPR